MPFGLTRHGEPILAYPLKRSVSTGIDYDDVRMLLGMVPEFEERDACIASGYRWQDWLALDSRDRAASVAHYRMRQVLEAHQQDAVQKARENEERRHRARRGSR